MKATSPEAYQSKRVKPAATDLVDRAAVYEDEHKVVYIKRFEPESWDEGAQYHEAGAAAYELYVICTDKGVIQEVNQRGEVCPCGGRSIAPHGAPAFLFPADAMFDVEWDDVAECAKARMLALLEEMADRGPKRRAGSSPGVSSRPAPKSRTKAR